MNMQTNRPNRAAQTALMTAAATVAVPLTYRWVRQNLDIMPEGGLSRLEWVTLGGVPQAVSIRGQDRRNPVLLFLHGGPGLPLMPYRQLLQELEKTFVVVHWDQRGAGKSFSPDIEEMSLARLVEDAVELTDYLRGITGQDKLFVVGHSSGSALGLMLADLAPERVHAYIGVGQVADMHASEALSYQFAVDKACQQNHARAIRQLQAGGPPPYNNHRAMLIERMWLQAFGGFFHRPYREQWKLMHAMWTCGDYTLADMAKIKAGVDFSCEKLWYPLYEKNFFEDIPRLNVPVCFIQGRYDQVTFGEVAERYFQALDAPRGKQWVWFERSAHWPLLEEAAHFSTWVRTMAASVLMNESLDVSQIVAAGKA
jgi:pimeloyl-ACP methyl ester carboxylesterase